MTSDNKKLLDELGFKLQHDDGEYEDYECYRETEHVDVKIRERVTHIVDSDEWYAVRLISDLAKDEDEEIGDVDTCQTLEDCLIKLGKITVSLS